MEEEALAQVMRNQAVIAGGVEGAVLGLFAEWQENRDVKDRLDNRKTAKTREQIAQLVRDVSRTIEIASPLDAGNIQDLFRGLRSGTAQIINGELVAAQRPAQLSAETVGAFSWPPPASVFNNGVLVSVGQNVRFGRLLSFPEVQAAIAGLQLPAEPTAAQKQQVYAYWQALQYAASQTGVPAALTAAQLATFAGQVAGNPLAFAQMQNTFQAELSPAAQIFSLASAAAGPLTTAQAQALAAYWSALITGAMGSPVASAAWIPQNSPSLADSALDAPWQYGAYSAVTGGYAATPSITTAVPGGMVVVGAAVASIQLFSITTTPNDEQQTVRRFTVLITTGSSAASGVQGTFYLPKALNRLQAPKVSLMADGSDPTLMKPYVTGRTGGTSPSFQIAMAATPSNSTAYRLMVEVSD